MHFPTVRVSSFLETYREAEGAWKIAWMIDPEEMAELNTQLTVHITVSLY